MGGLERFLRSLFWLFNDTYTRRTIYTQITGSDLFPLKFCSTRWVEDIRVATRAIDMWPHVTKYVHEIIRWKTKSEIPTCASFIVIKEAVLSNGLILAKLHFFVFVAKLLNPYLLKYQVIYLY